MSNGMGKKVTVFGGSGFLGSYVADELQKRGYSVLIADIRESPYLKPGQEFAQCNILNKEQVERVITNDTEFVYNFAALADIDEAMDKPVETININVMGNLNILEACRKHSVKRFVFASSAYAFSSKGSFYGISKHVNEKLIEEYYMRYGLDFTIIRYGSLYGERADHRNYIYSILRDALSTKKIQMRGDGQELREYIHAHDAAVLSVDIIESRNYVNDFIILTGVEKLKRIELLTMIGEILNDEVEIENVDSEYPGHYKYTPYSFHPNVARKLVANPFIDLGQGLVECLRHIASELDEQNLEFSFDAGQQT